MFRKSLVAIVVLLAVILLMVSCKQGSDLVPSKVIFNASNLDNKFVAISKDTEVVIENMDVSAVYAVITEGFDRSLSTRANEPTNIFFANEGTYIPIPDEQNKSVFKGENIHITTKGMIRVIKLRNGSTDNLAIEEESTSISYMTNYGMVVYDEYYHVNFKDDRYQELDKSRIAIGSHFTGGGAGGYDWGYVSIGEGGMIGPRQSGTGIFDLSDKDFINLYSTLLIFGESHSPFKLRLKVANPKEIEIKQDYHLSSDFEILSVGPLEGDKEYVLQIEHTGNSDLYQEDFNFRFANGFYSEIPLNLESTKDKLVYYIGKIEDELIGEIKVKDDSQGFGNVQFREINEDEKKYYESQLLKVDSEEFMSNKNVMFEKEILSQDDEEYQFIIKSDDREDLHRAKVRVEYTNKDGSSTTENNFFTGVRFSRIDGEGYSQFSKEGSDVTIEGGLRDIPERLIIQSLSEEDVDVKITIFK